MNLRKSAGGGFGMFGRYYQKVRDLFAATSADYDKSQTRKIPVQPVSWQVVFIHAAGAP